MYRITYEQGNGYRCSCCRESWTETIDFDTRDEVDEWLLELAADKVYCEHKIPVWDPDDREVIAIEKEFGVDIKDEFKISEKDIDAVIEKRKEVVKKEQQREEELVQKIEETEERVELRRLKEKYEN